MSPTITRKAYLTDLTPPQWVLLCPLLKLPDGGASKTTDLQEVLNGILYHLRTGCQWRLLPHDFPPDGGSACQGGLDLRKERSKIRSSCQKNYPYYLNCDAPSYSQTMSSLSLRYVTVT